MGCTRTNPPPLPHPVSANREAIPNVVANFMAGVSGRKASNSLRQNVNAMGIYSGF